MSRGKILTSDEVQALRHEHALGARVAELAVKYGVAASTVWRIVSHKTRTSL